MESATSSSVAELAGAESRDEETAGVTLAPNVEHRTRHRVAFNLDEDELIRLEDGGRRDTGYVSAMELSTPDDFCRREGRLAAGRTRDTGEFTPVASGRMSGTTARSADITEPATTDRDSVTSETDPDVLQMFLKFENFRRSLSEQQNKAATTKEDVVVSATATENQRITRERPSSQLMLGKPDNSTGTSTVTPTRKHALPTLKLGSFDGSTPLETFLAKFENCSDYYSWDDRERLCHLRASLDREAGQVLWDAGKQSTADDVIRLLRRRFGTQDQCERYRAELKALRRPKGSSLQWVYHEVRRLMALAFPGQQGAMWEVMARDAFLDALDDPTLRIRLLEKDPSSLDETLRFACHLEAISRPAQTVDGGYDDQGRRKERCVRGSNVDDDAALEKKFQRLEMTLEMYRDELQRCRQENSQLRQAVSAPAPAPAPVQPTVPVAVPAAVDSTSTAAAVPSTPRRAEPARCYGCGQPGHRVRDCPEKTKTAKMSGGGGGGGETYVEANVCGTHFHCLLDTGCERSLVPQKYVPNAVLTPTDLIVRAANGTRIPILGSVRLAFSIQGIPLTARLLVTDAVDEMMLGYDWLSENECEWLFTERKIVIHGKKIALKNRPSHATVRRVFVGEDTVIPPNAESLLPVNVTWSSLRAPKSDWLVEPKRLRSGVFVSRTLLPGDKNLSAVRVVNATDYPFRMAAGCSLGTATPAEVSSIEVDRVNETKSQGVSSRDDDHLGVVIDSLPSELSENERQQAIRFIHRHSSVFSKSEFDIGRTHLIPHRIDTGDNKPFRQSLRRHPKLHEQFIDDTVDEMLKNDIIEPAASPWASNVVLAKKSDGTLRFCVDYRQLNELTYKDSYPLPRISSCLDALGGSSFFSTLDLRSGFWQTAMDPRDADKTSFISRRGQFRFKVLSFGLANAPSLFQRIMDLVLAGLSWECCLVYVDDIVVFSKTFEQHIVRLTEVFNRLSGAGLKLKPNKCKLFQRRVTFLGHIVSGDGIEADPEKIAAIVDWPVPKNVGEVRSFLGLCSYYRNFIKDLSVIAAPLFDLTKKFAAFKWDENCQQAFDTLKERMTTAPVLASPVDGGGYVLDVDACDYGIGAVLQQYQEGDLRVIGYASRTLTSAERMYCTTRKEQLAVVYGLRQFRHYILGHETIVRSDHAALSYLKKAREPVGQQARWLDFIEQFNIEIRHRKGASHANADALSRRPCELQGTACGQCKGRHKVSDSEGEEREREVLGRAVTTRRQAAGSTGGSSNRAESGKDRSRPAANGLGPSSGRTAAARLPPESKLGSRRVHGTPAPEPEEKEREREEATDSDSGDASVVSDAKQQESHAVPVSCEKGEKRDVTEAAGLADFKGEWSVEQLGELQRADPAVSVVCSWLEAGVRPSRDEVVSLSPEIKSYAAQWETFALVNGVVYRKFERPEGGVKFWQLLAPKVVRTELVRMIHAGAAGHLGVKKTWEQVQRRAYWQTWRTDVENFCRTCGPCNQYHRGKIPKQGFLQDMRVGAPFERVQIDLTGPHPPANGYTYICTCICAFTKYVIAVPIRDKKATTVAKVLVERVILPFGSPNNILTDNGKEFENELWHEICRVLEINKQKTTTYHPACNGAIERWHRTMNSLLGKTVQTNQKDWPQKLPYVVSAYNGSRHDSTGFSPNFLMFGRELNVAVDIALGNPEGPPQSVNDYAAHLTENMANAYELVSNQLQRSAERNKQNYDVGVKLKQYQPGDLVWVYSPRQFQGRTPKWSRCFSGPFEVIRRVNEVNYVVRRSSKSAMVIVHVNKLKSYQAPAIDRQ